jgi:hypothetical protein
MPLKPCWLMLILLSWSAFAQAQTPSLQHNPVSESALRATDIIDSKLIDADAGHFTPLLQNRDRVHLQFTFGTQRTVRVSLSAAKPLGSDRALTVLSDIAHALQGTLMSRNLIMQEGSLLASGLVRLPVVSQGRPIEATIDWPGLFPILWKARLDRVEVRLRIAGGSLLRDSPCGVPWTRVSLGTRPTLAPVVTPATTVLPMRLRFDADPTRLQLAEAWSYQRFWWRPS